MFHRLLVPPFFFLNFTIAAAVYWWKTKPPVALTFAIVFSNQRWRFVRSSELISQLPCTQHNFSWHPLQSRIPISQSINQSVCYLKDIYSHSKWEGNEATFSTFIFVFCFYLNCQSSMEITFISILFYIFKLKKRRTLKNKTRKEKKQRLFFFL